MSLRLWSAAFIAALLSNPAGAQLGTNLGSNIPHAAAAEIPRGSRLSAIDRTREVIFAFGQCTVTAHRNRAEAALRLDPTSATYSHAMHELASSECLMSGEIQLTVNLMRGALYRALYKADFTSAKRPLAPAAIAFSEDVPGNTSGDALNYIALHEFGDCVVRADPDAAREIILAPVASGNEDAGYRKLGPRFGPCLTSRGAVEFTKLLLTGLIAEALYRETIAGAPPAAAAKP